MRLPDPEEVDFCAISISQRIAVTGDGRQYRIVNMFDDAGDETDIADEVVALVVEMRSDLFAVVDMTDFVDAPLN